MLGKIWDLLREIRRELILLNRLLAILADRTGLDTETLSTQEACRYASVSESTLRSWRARGLIRGAGGRWSRRDLETLARARALGQSLGEVA